MAKSIDPHKVFNNNQSVELDNLNYFAELTVTKRNRLNVGASDKPLVISFLGANDNGEFTTNWTNNDENFGIKSIDIKMTSSYVPQVDIVFEDVRGQALMNNFNDSKYKILFDMPPPIFDLKVKGNYGQPVTYRLHMIKNYISLVNNNSFEIHASFVGMTFAPLADIYTDYIQVAPYLNGDIPSEDSEYTYLQLIEKSKELTTQLKTVTSKDVIKINDLGIVNGDLDVIKNNYQQKFNDEIINLDNNRNIINVSNDEKNSGITVIKYRYESTATEKYPQPSLYTELYDLVKSKIDFLNKNKIEPKIIKSLPQTYNSLPRIKINDANRGYVEICKIDFTAIDKKIYDRMQTNIEEMDKVNNGMISNVNKAQVDILRGAPTLNRILGIIMKDAKTFFTALKNVVIQAENERKGNADAQHGDELRFAFPNYYKKGNNQQNYLTLPPENFPEVQFVNKYINAKLKAVDYINSQKAKGFDAQSGQEYIYTPINVFDTIIQSRESIFDSISLNNIVDVMIKRGMIILNFTTNLIDMEELKIYAKGDAQNLINSLKNDENKLNAFILIIEKESFKFQTVDTPFNIQLKAGNVTQIEGASKDVIYKGKSNFSVKNISDFDALKGVPEIKSFFDTDVLTKLNEKNNKKLCQYNVPLFVDEEMTSGFKNTSMYIDGDIFEYYDNTTDSLSNITSPDVFFERVLSEKIILPYDYGVSSHKLMIAKYSGIFQVPRIVLATWGYMCLKNSTSDWIKIPQFIKNIFIRYYNEFNAYYIENCVIKGDSVPQYIQKLRLAEKHNGDLNSQEELFQTDFIKFIIEIQYVNVGDPTLFVDSTIDIGDISNSKAYNTYFDTLKLEILRIKTETKKEIQEQNSLTSSKINNNDLKTQLYYTFKSLVDKWMLNTSVDVDAMFDITKSGDTTQDGLNITNFLVVDRGFNNIGNDVVVDLSPIHSTETTSDTSLYTLLLNLLTKNNFEFFALPSFIEYGSSNQLWSEDNLDLVFGTHQTANTITNPKFICMYVGGTSSQLDINTDGSSHPDDSDKFENITDLENGVQAFRIDFGTTSQSFFNGLELSQLEFKETNESIKILDNIANNVDVTTTNSLFNTYEQRSYTASVKMMGDMMIQPTMYFDLHNVAMFKGTYLILEVNHKVYPNGITTSFKGVRIPKVAKPYVTEYYKLNNIDGYNPSLIGSTSVSNTGNSKITSKDMKDVREAIHDLGKVKTAGLSNQEKAFLDVLSYAEGTLGFTEHNGYNCLFGHIKIPAWKPDYSLGHGLKYWEELGNGHSAAGRYQYLDSTWLGFATGENSSIDPSGRNKAFSASNQDKTCVKSINARLKPNGLKIPTVNPIKENEFVRYIDCMAREWASLPFYGTIPYKRSDLPANWNAGDGYYSDQGGKYSKEELWLVYNIALKAYEGKAMSDADIDSLVSKINAKNGDSNGGRAVQKLIAKYGELDVLNKDMKPSDRLTDKNKKFISENIIKWIPPADIKNNITILPSIVEINKDLKAPLEKTLRSLIAKGLHYEIKTFDGCFNIRPQRNSSVVSTHAYAMALDLNASMNPFGGKTTFSDAFISTWEENLFIAGARFGRGREDGMHYEYTRNV